MAKKLALVGFKRLSLFPILEDTYDKYEVGEKILVEHAISMTREQESNESEIYADDALYAKVVDFKGIKSTITVAETSLPLLAELGFGNWNGETKEFKANPQGMGKSFGATFACETIGGDTRMFKFYNFTITSIKDSTINTKGSGSGVGNVEIEGIFSNRKLDSGYYLIKDSENGDLEWLDYIDLPANTTTRSTRKTENEGA